MANFDDPRTPNKSAAESDDHITRHCFVLVKDDSAGDLSRASSVVAEVFGPGYAADCGDEGVVTVTHGTDTVGFLAHIPMAIPEREAEDNADGNFLWPKGRKEAAHRSHVIVTNVGGGQQTPIHSVITVARLALVALKLFNGSAVYWGNARVCNSRSVFEDFCENMSPEGVPVPVILRFQLVPASPDGFGMYTLGMSQFNLMDIEVERGPMEVGDLFEFVANLAHYLIQSGPIIEDGNTVGGSEEERIVVRHLPSMIDKTKTVYKVLFDGA